MDSRLPQVVVTQLGARMHYAVPVIFQQAGMLGHFFTDSYVGVGSSWRLLSQIARLLPASRQPQGLRRLLARRDNGLPADKVTAFNRLGWRYGRDLARPTGWQDKIHLWENLSRDFCRLILKHEAFQGEALYTFQGAALPLLEKGAAQGMVTFCEQFSAPERIQQELFSEEYGRWPDWEPPYPALDLFQSRLTVEKQEWAAADTVICASDFVAQGLAFQGVPADKIRVVPYGFEPAHSAHDRRPRDDAQPLRILFVGGVTLRKGPQYLYRALEQLASPHLEARLVGPISIRDPYARLLRTRLELTGMVPRPEVWRHYEWADVFVFPTICEGSATVCYEALSAGLPVITTPNAGSVIRDGIDGFIVPIRDSEALAEKIDLLARDRTLLRWMSQNARERAREFSIEKYGERLVQCILSDYSANAKNVHEK